MPHRFQAIVVLFLGLVLAACATRNPSPDALASFDFSLDHSNNSVSYNADYSWLDTLSNNDNCEPQAALTPGKDLLVTSAALNAGTLELTLQNVSDSRYSQLQLNGQGKQQLGTLAAGESVKVSLDVEGTSDVKLTATANRTCTRKTADISVTARASSNPVALGETFGYQVLIKNNGPDAAHNLTFKDILKQEGKFVLELIEAKLDGEEVAFDRKDNLLVDGCKGDREELVCRLDSLAVGETITVDLKVKVLATFDTPDRQAIGTIINSITAASVSHDPNPKNNKVTSEIDIIKKRMDGEPETGTIIIIKDTVPDAGQDFEFFTSGLTPETFMLDDDADPTLSNTQVFSNVPAGSYSVAEAVDNFIPAPNYEISSIVCDDPSNDSSVSIPSAFIELAADETVTCTFTNSFVEPDPETADVSIGNDEFDTSLTGKIFYAPEYRNAGPATAENVVVVVTLPEGVMFAGVDGCNNTPVPTNRQFTCELGNLAAGETGFIDVETAITDTAKTSFTFEASISTTTPESNETNNDTSASVEVELGVVGLRIDKTVRLAGGGAIPADVTIPDFRFDWSCNDGEFAGDTTVFGNQYQDGTASIFVAEVPDGAFCEVTERDTGLTDGWSRVGSASQTQTVTAPATTFDFVNEYTPPDTGACTNPVNIPDANLEQAIRDELGKQTGAITCEDLQGLTQLIAGGTPGRRISNLEGLQVAENLEFLFLNGNQISDISPLANLMNLKDLFLSGNQISDVSLLANLINLDRLALSSNQVSDLTPLANLTGLTQLAASDNPLSDISPLANLINLEELRLSSNPLSDISPLANLINLRVLDLGDNQISDISSLANLINLETLEIDDNQISDISSLANLINLEILRLSGNQISDISSLANLTDLIRLNLASNQISDISSLANLINLDSLRISDNQISDISSLANLTDLIRLNLASNQISDISSLANLINLIELLLEDNQISDIEPLVANADLGNDFDGILLTGNCLDLFPGSEDQQDVDTIEARNPALSNVTTDNQGGPQCSAP